jgi:RNA polymerase sigma-70 factor (ECF subfamily)
MSNPNVTNGLVNDLRTDDPDTFKRLINHTYQRLERHTHNMLRTFGGVRQREQTGDVHHNALIRLQEAFSESKLELKSARHFYQVAANHIRWELLSLAEKYRGPKWSMANQDAGSTGGAVAWAADPATGPDQFLKWVEFQVKAKELPPDLKEVFDLIWYNGATQKEAAEILDVCERTLKRRWVDVRLALDQMCNGDAPNL